jgi:3-oxoacyl-[acyl-carrier protein] reductase
VKRALILGGTGVVGREVMRELCRQQVACEFTFHRNHALAEALSQELHTSAFPLDAKDGPSLVRFVAERPPFDIFVHCAGSLHTAQLSELTETAFDEALALTARSAMVLTRELARGMTARGAGDILFVGGLDRAQSLPIPIAYAAAQGALAAMTMALAKELAPHGVRVHMMALGLLTDGLSLGLDPKLREDFVNFSALRRLGTAEEAARAIAWLVLHNRYLNGKVIPINGGL